MTIPLDGCWEFFFWKFILRGSNEKIGVMRFYRAATVTYSSLEPDTSAQEKGLATVDG